MDKYLKYDNDYRITTFYSEDVHSDIPSGCIKITEDVWRELLNNTENYKVKTGLSTEIVYDNIDNIVYLDNIVLILEETKPSQAEIDFALYVLENEDRLALLESKINGGV